MSSDKLAALIERIASEHGIVLSQDDPVLMMHTLNEVLLEQNEKAHAELLSNYQAILEENFNRWCEYSTKKSNALINASMNLFSSVDSSKIATNVFLVRVFDRIGGSPNG